MKISRKISLICCVVMLLMIGLTACGKGNTIVGMWASEDNSDLVEFKDDGSCSAPFTYSAAWIESADKYTVKDDGTLILSSPSGHANETYEKTDNEEDALDDSSLYYLSDDTLIIERDKYTRTK